MKLTHMCPDLFSFFKQKEQNASPRNEIFFSLSLSFHAIMVTHLCCFTNRTSQPPSPANTLFFACSCSAESRGVMKETY